MTLCSERLREEVEFVGVYLASLMGRRMVLQVRNGIVQLLCFGCGMVRMYHNCRAIEPGFPEILSQLVVVTTAMVLHPEFRVVKR